MTRADNILMIQTAFIGDVILTLPLVQKLKEVIPRANIDVVVAPRAKDVLAHHPDIREAIVFDKRGKDRGLPGLLHLRQRLRERHYDIALIPHRSLRSALLAWLLHIPVRVGFHKSSGRFLYTRAIRYRQTIHEIERNLFLLEGLGLPVPKRELPRLYPSEEDRKRVDKLLFELEVIHPERLVAVAPGTIWNTKRWHKERFGSLAVNLDDAGYEVMLVGGKEDEELCSDIHALSGSPKVYSTAGTLSLLQSAELIRRCKVLISNDSAPMHLAVAMRTPVIAIFGATIPEFGFGPVGEFDAIVETRGLPCRPCSIHGGEKCPIKTFECIHAITHERVFRVVKDVLHRAKNSKSSRVQE